MAANLENFEFAALQQADNYRVALLAEFAPHLRGHVLEVGSGIGQLTDVLQQKPEIFAPIDRDFGHFRRYSRAELKEKLETAGFSVNRLAYFNLLGYFGWWWNFHLLKKRRFAVTQVRIFDRLIFPLQHRFEARVLRPPIGMSLLAIASATGSTPHP